MRSIVLVPVLTFMVLKVVGCGDSATGQPDVDAAVTVDAQTDTSSQEDAATEETSTPDAAVADANVTDAADAAPPFNALYAHIDGKLLSVDTSTGALTEVGPTGQTWITLAWDSKAKVARVILGNYSPQGAGGTTPKLGTINLCTGVVTAGPNIAINNVQVRRAEGLAQDPATGTFYVTIGSNGTGAPTEFLTESNGTIDVATGAVTVLGNHSTYQNDGDLLVSVAGAINMLDVATANNQGAIYTLNTTNGQTTKRVDTGPKLLRFTSDETRGIVYATYGEANFTARGVATLNITTGAFTKLGTDILNTLYPGGNFNGLLSAPKPICPVN